MLSRSRLLLLVVVLALLLTSLAVPTTSAHAVRQITITITETQLTKYLNANRDRSNLTSIVVDIVDGGIVVNIHTRWTDLPEYAEHFGVLNRDNKIVAEPGVVSFPNGVGIGYEEIQQSFPEEVALLQHNAKFINRYILRMVSAKAGSRYTVESITLGSDKLVIVVNK